MVVGGGGMAVVENEGEEVIGVVGGWRVVGGVVYGVKTGAHGAVVGV